MEINPRRLIVRFPMPPTLQRALGDPGQARQLDHPGHEPLNGERRESAMRYREESLRDCRRLPRASKGLVCEIESPRATSTLWRLCRAQPHKHWPYSALLRHAHRRFSLYAGCVLLRTWNRKTPSIQLAKRHCQHQDLPCKMAGFWD